MTGDIDLENPSTKRSEATLARSFSPPNAKRLKIGHLPRDTPTVRTLLSPTQTTFSPPDQHVESPEYVSPGLILAKHTG